MEVHGVLVLLAALAVSAVSSETDVTFPEIARERTGSRIVSGWEASDGQFPYQLSLRMVSPEGGVSSCGGTIISAEWGLTAAHCTAGHLRPKAPLFLSRVTMVLRAGVVNLTLPYTIFETTVYYNHPLYDESRPGVVQPHDIGLLEFGRSLELSDYVQPIRIQRSLAKDANYAGVRLTASGWGRTWTLGSSPENLNWVYLSGVSNQFCSVAFGGSSIIVDSTICASGYNVTSQSTCQGDSGGPLTVIDDDGAVSQVGVTSFVSGTGCHTNVPAGFIRPGYYHDWFTEVTGINFDWEYDIPTTTDDSTTVTATTDDPTTVTATTDEATTVPTTTVAEEEEIDCEDEDDEAEAIRVHFVNNK